MSGYDQNTQYLENVNPDVTQAYEFDGSWSDWVLPSDVIQSRYGYPGLFLDNNHKTTAALKIELPYSNKLAHYGTLILKLPFHNSHMSGSGRDTEFKVGLSKVRPTKHIMPPNKQCIGQVKHYSAPFEGRIFTFTYDLENLSFQPGEPRTIYFYIQDLAPIGDRKWLNLIADSSDWPWTYTLEVIYNKSIYNVTYDNGNGIIKKYPIVEGQSHVVQAFGIEGCNFTAPKIYLTCKKNDGTEQSETYSKEKVFSKWQSNQGESRPGEVLSNLISDIKFVAVLNDPTFPLVEISRERTFKQEITTTFLDGDKEIDVLKTNHYNTYKMAGWSHYAVGEAQYAPISSITIGTDTTLFAIWNVGIQKESLTVPDAPKKGAAYIFQNWINTVGNVVLIPQNKYTPDLSEGFHAVWANRGAIRIDTKGQYVLAQPYIFSQGQWNLCLPYVRDNNNWKLGG